MINLWKKFRFATSSLFPTSHSILPFIPNFPNDVGALELSLNALISTYFPSPFFSSKFTVCYNYNSKLYAIIRCYKNSKHLVLSKFISKTPPADSLISFNYKHSPQKFVHIQDKSSGCALISIHDRTKHCRKYAQC